MLRKILRFARDWTEASARADDIQFNINSNIHGRISHIEKEINKLKEISYNHESAMKQINEKK
jgi:hypothetical protein